MKNLFNTVLGWIMLLFLIAGVAAVFTMDKAEADRIRELESRPEKCDTIVKHDTIRVASDTVIIYRSGKPKRLGPASW